MEIIRVGNYSVLVERKRVKHIYLKINRYDASIKVTAPIQNPFTQIEDFVKSRQTWLEEKVPNIERLKRQKKVLSLPLGIDGERCFVWGESYTLRIIHHQGRSFVRLVAPYLEIYTKPQSTSVTIQKILERWYKSQIEEEITMILPLWMEKLNVSVTSWHCKKMKTKWGTCNTLNKRIWLNTYLVYYPKICVEAVLVHELLHLIERKHSKRFWALLKNFYPLYEDADCLLQESDILSSL